jgi:hypothetical protein
VHPHCLASAEIHSNILLTKMDKIYVQLAHDPAKIYNSGSVEQLRIEVAALCGYQPNQVFPAQLYSTEIDRNKYVEQSALIALTQALTHAEKCQQRLRDKSAENSASEAEEEHKSAPPARGRRAKSRKPKPPPYKPVQNPTGSQVDALANTLDDQRITDNRDSYDSDK